MRPTVLLAESQALVLEAFCRLLEPEFEVLGRACDGIRLVEEALRLEPALVLTDVVLPRLSGLSAARRLRKELPGTRVVFLASQEDPQVVAEALRLRGEVFVRHARGSWRWAAEMGMSGCRVPVVLALPGPTGCDPIGRVFERYSGGPTDSVAALYEAAVAADARGRGPHPGLTAARSRAARAAVPAVERRGDAQREAGTAADGRLDLAVDRLGAEHEPGPQARPDPAALVDAPERVVRLAEVRRDTVDLRAEPAHREQHAPPHLTALSLRDDETGVRHVDPQCSVGGMVPELPLRLQAV